MQVTLLRLVAIIVLFLNSNLLADNSNLCQNLKNNFPIFFNPNHNKKASDKDCDEVRTYLISNIQSKDDLNIKCNNLTMGKIALLATINSCGDNQNKLLRHIIKLGQNLNTNLLYDYETVLDAFIRECSFQEGNKAQICLQNIQDLISAGANVNKNDGKFNAPLLELMACLDAERPVKIEMAKLLIDHGADVNSKNKAGLTPLLYLASSVYAYKTLLPVELAKLLIDHGANVNARAVSNYGESMPLIALTMCNGSILTQNSIDVAKLLIDHGADVNAKDAHNLTPLENLQIQDCQKTPKVIEMATLFIIHGAKFDVIEMAKLLINHGAKFNVIDILLSIIGIIIIFLIIKKIYQILKRKYNNFIKNKRIQKVKNLCAKQLKTADGYLNDVNSDKFGALNIAKSFTNELSSTKNALNSIINMAGNISFEQSFTELEETKKKLYDLNSKLKALKKINLKELEEAQKLLDLLIGQIKNLSDRIFEHKKYKDAHVLIENVNTLALTLKRLHEDMLNLDSAQNLSSIIKNILKDKGEYEAAKKQWDELEKQISVIINANAKLDSLLNDANGLQNIFNRLPGLYKEVRELSDGVVKVIGKINEKRQILNSIDNINSAKSLISSVNDDIIGIENEINALNRQYGSLKDACAKASELSDIANKLHDIELRYNNEIIHNINQYMRFNRVKQFKLPLDDIISNIQTTIRVIKNITTLDNIDSQCVKYQKDYQIIANEFAKNEQDWNNLKRMLKKLNSMLKDVNDLMSQATDAERACKSISEDKNALRLLPLFTNIANRLKELDTSLQNINEDNLQHYESNLQNLKNELNKLLEEYDSKLELVKEFKALSNDMAKKEWILKNGKLSWLFNNKDVASKFEEFDSQESVKTLASISNSYQLYFFETSSKSEEWKSIMELMSSNMTLEDTKSIFLDLVRNERFKNQQDRCKKKIGEEHNKIVSKFLNMSFR